MNKTKILELLRDAGKTLKQSKTNEEKIYFPELYGLDHTLRDIIKKLDTGYLSYKEIGELIMYIADMLE